MIIPMKHEPLNKSILAIGSYIIQILLKRSHSIENLFQEVKKNTTININLFYDTLLFLWLSDIVQVDNSIVNILIAEEKL